MQLEFNVVTAWQGGVTNVKPRKHRIVFSGIFSWAILAGVAWQVIAGHMTGSCK